LRLAGKHKLNLLGSQASCASKSKSGVLLKFAEIYRTKAGQRIFNLSINGSQVLTNFAIIAAAGAPLTPIDKSFPVTVTNNQITIQFIPGSVDNPKVSATEVQ
jgi:Malectin domain